MIDKKYNKLLFTSIISLGFALRLYFYMGHIFSDDAYFTYLSYTLYNGEYGADYIGYPVSLLRFNLHVLTVAAFTLFGPNELAASFFPMLFSIANLFLTYFLTKQITKSEKTALTAMFLMAAFPTEIIFAGLAFADAFCAFFINLGIFLLFIAHEKKAVIPAVFAGLSLAVSIQFKINVFFIGLLLGILLVYELIKHRKLNPYISIALIFTVLNLIIEGLIYLKLHDNFLYRFVLTEQNYLFGRDNFFVKGSAFGYASDAEYWTSLFKMLFIYNPKAVFLRRFLLFLPLLALVQSFISIRKNEYKLLSYWFLGLALVFLFFTSSFQTYQPLVQRFTWYIFPLFMPAVILSAVLLVRFKTNMRSVLLLVYFAGSIIMCGSYQEFFDKKENDELKDFLKNNPSPVIYTDHFTKYSIDLIDGYRQPLRTNRILGKDFNWKQIQPGSVVVFSRKHIRELEGQNFEFPGWGILQHNGFFEKSVFGDFIIYEKKEQAAE